MHLAIYRNLNTPTDSADEADLTLRETGLPHGNSFQSARKSNILWPGIRGSVPTHVTALSYIAITVFPYPDTSKLLPSALPDALHPGNGIQIVAIAKN